MTFPNHVLDDVTYCTRTKSGLELYFPTLIRCQLFEAYNPWQMVLFLWWMVSFHNTPTYQIRSVAIYKRHLCLCKWPKWRLPALAWVACQGYQASGGRRTVHDWSWTPLFDPGKLCRPINNIRSSTLWLHRYNPPARCFKVHCVMLNVSTRRI